MEKQGFNLYVDAVAMNFLRGVEIDFVERPTGASFVFNNVFAATGGSGTCGACGAAGGGCG
jgi:iron-sulfur cluster insertion protein